MAKFANITSGTGEAAVTFSAAGYSGDAAVYENRKSGIPLGYETLTVRTVKNANVRRTRMVINLPKLQTSSSVAADGFVPGPRVQHANRVTLEFVSSNASTTIDRQLMLDRIKMILADATAKAVVVDQEDI